MTSDSEDHKEPTRIGYLNYQPTGANRAYGRENFSKDIEDESSSNETYSHNQIKKNPTAIELWKVEFAHLHSSVEYYLEEGVLELIQALPNEDIQDENTFRKISKRVKQILQHFTKWRQKGTDNMFELYNRLLKEEHQNQDAQNTINQLSLDLEHYEKVVDEKDAEIRELRSKLSEMQSKFKIINQAK